MTRRPAPRRRDGRGRGPTRPGAPTRAEAPAAPAVPGERAWVLPLATALVTGVVFARILFNGFIVNFDDRGTFLANRHFRGLGLEQLAWMWTTFYSNQYRPLTWMVYGATYVLGGLDPFGYHLASLLLHALNTALFYLVARRLLALAAPATDGRGLVVAATGATLLFAVHPLRVEPVAWASAQADLLAVALLLLAVLAYLRANTQPPWGRAFWATVGLYALSLLAKPAALGLPIALAVLDVYPLGRLGGPRTWLGARARRVWLEKIPFVVATLLVGMIALFAKAGAGVTASLETFGVSTSLGRAFFSVVFHLWKTLVPLGLSPMYQVRPDGQPPLPLVLTATIVVAVTGVLVILRRRWPAALAAWIAYGVLLVPVSGVIQFGPQSAADRFTYLPCLPWALAGGGLLVVGWRAWRSGRLPAYGAAAVAAATGLAIAGLAALTWNLAGIWRDEGALWAHALAVTPSTMAHNNLGEVLYARGDVDGALEHFRAAVKLSPSYPRGFKNLGMALLRQGKLDEALPPFVRATELLPTADGYSNVGLVLTHQGRLDEAVGWYEKALALNPRLAEAHNNLGFILARQGRLDEAIAHYRRALQARPSFPEAQRNLDMALGAQRGGADASSTATPERQRLPTQRR